MATLPLVVVVLLPGASMAQEGNSTEPAPANTQPADESQSSGSESVLPELTLDLPTLWELAVRGGIFMIPIVLGSIVAIAFALERLIGLRRNRILPMELISDLRELIAKPQIDPRDAWKLTQEHPSPLATAIQAGVLKVGRPHAEVEKSVEDAVARETAEMSRNLRPINVVASIAPLLGLSGTVQGMIMAFMVMSTTSSTGAAKAQELAEGIYTALVTTFAGLCVAVLSVVVANFLEGRIERLLKQMEELFLELVPLFERYEGKYRVSRSPEENDELGIVVKNIARKASTRSTAAQAESEPGNGNSPKSLWGVMVPPEPAETETVTGQKG